MNKYMPFWKFRDTVSMTVWENKAGNIAVKFQLGEWERTYTTSYILWDTKRYEEADYLERLAHDHYIRNVID
jgi:hypothetical protein